MNNPGRLLLALLLLGGMLALGWWTGAHRGDRTTLAANTTVPTINADAAIARGNQETNAAGVQAKSSAVVQADRYSRLLDEIRRGDAHAAYQLAQGREACAQLRIQEWVQRAKQEAAPPARLRTESEIRDDAELKSRLDAARENCIGDKNASAQEIHDAWARAARMGSRDAQYDYALNPRLDPRTAGNDVERWRHWKATAPGYLDSALQAGDARAAIALAAASDRDDCRPLMADDICARGELLGAIVEQDVSTAYAYLLLDRLIGDPANAAWVDRKLAELGRVLSPQQIANATAKAQQLFARSGHNGGAG